MSNTKVQMLINQMNKKFKTELCFSGEDMQDVDFIPFSSPKANWVTRGGIAQGRLVEFVGAEGSGKTTSAFDVVGNYQKMYPDKVAVYLDAENTADKDWATKLGVDIENMIWIKPEREHAEKLLQMVLDFIDSGDVGLIVIDSLPFLIPKAVMEGTLEDKTYCGNSGVMTEFARKVCGKLSKSGCTCVIINQLRDKVGSTYVTYHTTGGRMLKHAYSQRLFFYKGKFIDENCKEQTNSVEEPQGNIVGIKIEKNKVTKPDRRVGSYTLNYQHGVDILNDTVDMAVYMGLIQQAGSWYRILDDETGEIAVDSTTGEELKFQGKTPLLDKLRADSTVYQWLYELVNEKAK